VNSTIQRVAVLVIASISLSILMSQLLYLDVALDLMPSLIHANSKTKRSPEMEFFKDQRFLGTLSTELSKAPTSRNESLKNAMVQQTMTQSVVSQYFNMVYAGAEPELIASLFSEDVDFYIPGAVDIVPWIGRRYGRSGVVNFIQELRSYTEPIKFDIRSIVVEGHQGIALGELETLVKSTGKIIKSEFAFEFSVQGGLITRYRIFEDSFAVAKAIRQSEINAEKNHS